ncbi:MAG: MarR family transcriptional regulator [Pseudomonadota bacterium]
MTEIAEYTVELSPAIRRFILHWGDMGGQWGVNRSVAQIHALLLMSDAPLNAEQIAATLGLARSNVSNSVKELVTWKLVRRAPLAGDRRDHFEAEGDMWEMVSRIVAMRKARELDPAASVLDACLTDAREDPAATDVAVKRLAELQDLIALLNGWYEQMDKLPKSTLLPLIRMGTKAVDLIAPLAGGKRTQKE